jgi:hypothetical protein
MPAPYDRSAEWGGALAMRPDGFWIRCEVRGRIRAALAVKHCYQRAGDDARAAAAQRRIDGLLDRYNTAPLIAAFDAAVVHGGLL